MFNGFAALLIRRCKIKQNANTILEGELKKWMILPSVKNYVVSNKEVTFLTILKKSGRNIEV
jgi:hypothetical protein